jgi:hypothetical protein
VGFLKLFFACVGFYKRGLGSLVPVFFSVGRGGIMPANVWVMQGGISYGCLVFWKCCGVLSIFERFFGYCFKIMFGNVGGNCYKSWFFLFYNNFVIAWHDFFGFSAPKAQKNFNSQRGGRTTKFLVAYYFQRCVFYYFWECFCMTFFIFLVLLLFSFSLVMQGKCGFLSYSVIGGAASVHRVILGLQLFLSFLVLLIVGQVGGACCAVRLGGGQDDRSLRCGGRKPHCMGVGMADTLEFIVWVDYTMTIGFLL